MSFPSDSNRFKENLWDIRNYLVLDPKGISTPNRRGSMRPLVFKRETREDWKGTRFSSLFQLIPEISMNDISETLLPVAKEVRKRSFHKDV